MDTLPKRKAGMPRPAPASTDTCQATTFLIAQACWHGFAGAKAPPPPPPPPPGGKKAAPAPPPPPGECCPGPKYRIALNPEARLSRKLARIALAAGTAMQP